VSTGGEVYFQEFGPRGGEAARDTPAEPAQAAPSAPDNVRNQLF